MTSRDGKDGRVSPSGPSATAADLRLSATDIQKPTLPEFNTHWKILGLLGKGAFAQVFKVCLHGNIYALKLLIPDRKGNLGSSCVMVMFREARALKTCSHRSIVSFHGLVKVPAHTRAIGNSTARWGILLEWCPGGDVSHKIYDGLIKEKKIYTIPQALRWSVDIAGALAYMHTMEPPMLHRDVKTDNILLLGDKGPAKLADFGLHQVIDHDKQPGMFVRRMGMCSARATVSRAGSGTPSRLGSNRGIIFITAADKARMSDAEGHLQPELLEAALMARLTRASLQATRSIPAGHPTEETGSSLRAVSACPLLSSPERSHDPQQAANGGVTGGGEAASGLTAQPGTPRATNGQALDGREGGCVTPSPSLASPAPVGQGATEQPGSSCATPGKALLDVHCTAPGKALVDTPCTPTGKALVDAHCTPGSVGSGVVACLSSCNGAVGSPGGSNHGTHRLAHLSPHARQHLSPGPNLVRVSRASSAVKAAQAPQGGTDHEHAAEHAAATDSQGSAALDSGQVHTEVLDPLGQSHESTVWQDLEQGKDMDLDDADCYEAAYNLTGNQGARYYMAPEVFLEQPYNQKADVFSFGAVLYEVFSYSTLGLFSEQSLDYVKKVASGWRPPKIEGLPDRLWELIEACMLGDQGARPDMVLVVEQLEEILATVESQRWFAIGRSSQKGGAMNAASCSKAEAPHCQCTIS